MFRDMFGDLDEEDFSGFELEDIERQYNNEDGVAVGIVDEGDDKEIRRVVRVEDLQWSREAGHIDLPVFCSILWSFKFPSTTGSIGIFSSVFQARNFQTHCRAN